MSRLDPRLRFSALVLAGALTLSGCGLELRDVPMPGLVSGPTYTVDAVFANALNLPEQAPVKLGGDTIGEVESITVDNFRARVRLRLGDAVVLRRGTRADIRLTSAMGEAFVELVPPARPGARIRPGQVLGLEATRTAPDSTDLLAALSMVVTGGSFADVQVIVTELRRALHGNSSHVRRLLHRLDHMVTGLNRRTASIDSVLDHLDQLTASLAEDSDTISNAVQEITPAVTTLARQREAAMALLRELAALSRAGRRVIGASRHEIVAQLVDVEPILDTVVRKQKSLEPLLKGISAFAHALDHATPGDFANFQLTTLLDVRVNGGLPLVDLPPGKPPALDPPEWSSEPRLPGPLNPDDLDPRLLQDVRGGRG